MNESLRQPKMAYSEKLNNFYGNYAANFVLSTILLLPATFFARRFFLKRGGVPTTYM